MRHAEWQFKSEFTDADTLKAGFTRRMGIPITGQAKPRRARSELCASGLHTKTNRASGLIEVYLQKIKARSLSIAQFDSISSFTSTLLASYSLHDQTMPFSAAHLKSGPSLHRVSSLCQDDSILRAVMIVMFGGCNLMAAVAILSISLLSCGLVEIFSVLVSGSIMLCQID